MNSCDGFLKKFYGELSYRDYSLLDRAVRTLESNSAGAPGEIFPWHPMRGIRPSHGSANAATNYAGIWNWDCAFHAMAAMYWDQELARDQIRIFLSIQQPDGKLPDVWHWDRNDPEPIFSGASKPPVMAWAAWEVDNNGHDREFLQLAYDGFVKNEGFWRTARFRDTAGLFHYDGDTGDPALRKLWSGWESGWDNSPRWDNGAYNLYTVDLNCYMVLFYRALEKMALRLGETAAADMWRQREEALSAAIEEKLWNSEAGCYTDFDYSADRHISVITPASFMPLFIRTASPERAVRMAEIAREHMMPGWPSVSYKDPAYEPRHYWRGPTWLNVAYFALRGLKEYGFTDIADSGRELLLDWAAGAPDAFYEYYDSRTGEALGVNHYGWSAAFVIKFLLDWEKPVLL